jgi:hypothetical protein
MVNTLVRMLAVAVCLACALHIDSAAIAAANEVTELDGLWSGFWGLLIEPDGTVHQPIKAELFIQGGQVEWTGFPGVDTLTGTIRIDPATKQIRVAPAAKAGGQPADRIVFAYKLTGDHLTLIDSNKRHIEFSKDRVNPMAGVKVEFLAAVEIDKAGDLLVTDFEVHRAGQSKEPGLALGRRPLSTKQAVMLLIQEGGLKKVSLDEVRRIIRSPTPIVVAYRPDDRPSLPLSRQWQPADSEAVGRTVCRVLRPGTLLIVVPQAAKVAPPP